MCQYAFICFPISCLWDVWLAWFETGVSISLPCVWIFMVGFLCVCIFRTGRRQFRAPSSRPTLRPVSTPTPTPTRPWWTRPGWDRQPECRHHKILTSSTCCTHATRFLHHAAFFFFFFCFGKTLSILAFSRLLWKVLMHVSTARESVSDELCECITGFFHPEPCVYSQNLVQNAKCCLLSDVSHSCGLSWMVHMSHSDWSWMKKSWYEKSHGMRTVKPSSMVLGILHLHDLQVPLKISWKH